MSGVAFEITETGLNDALLKIENIEQAPTGELMEGISRQVQEQTRHRIESEKTSPDGAAWQPNWKGSSILYASGALSRSINYVATDTSAQVGSGLVYARIHNDGGVIKPKDAKALTFQLADRLVQVKSVTMPQRQFLGLSAANRIEIIQTTEDWLGGLLQ